MADDINFQIKISKDLQDAISPNQNQRSNDRSPNLAQSDQDNTNTTVQNERIFDLKRSSHPVAAAFHLLFKVVGVLIYFLLNLTTGLKLLTFLLIILCGAFDFWTVKNITGRLLVGLRWHNEILDDNTEKWIFESYDEKVQLNLFDKTLFWWTQGGMVIFWFVMTIIQLIGFDFFWATSTIICLVLNISNYIGFYKCSKDHQKKVKDLMQKAAIAGIKKNMGV